jgi:tetratricopeptide (TPR) repeat protein
MNRFYLICLIPLLILSGCGKEEGGETMHDFDTLWDFTDPAATESKFRELLLKTESSDDPSYKPELYTQIARAEGLQGKFDEAHATLDQVEDMLTDELMTARIRYLLERGRVYNSSGDPEKSKSYFIEAFERGREHGADFYAVDAAHMMAIVESPKKQLEWSGKAMDLAERSKSDRAKKWLGPLYNNTGWSYHDLGQYDKALELFEKSLAWREEQKDEVGTRIAKWTIGRCYRSLDQIDEALDIQYALEKEFEEKGIESDGYVFEEIGECLLIQGKDDQAKPYFKRAYDLLSKDGWIAANEPKRLERLKELSE